MTIRRELIGPDGRDEQDPFVAQVPDQEGDQVPRRRVGPLEVLDQEDDGGDPGQALEDAEHELEEPDLGETFVRGRRDPGVAGSIGGGPGRSGTHLGHEARELVPVRTEQGREPARVRVTDQSAESFDERRIGQTAGRQGEAAAASALGLRPR